MIETSDTTFELGPFLLHRNKGREHYEAEEFALARRDLELANRIRPEDADVLYWLGTSYFRLDQHPEAERCFRDSLEIRRRVQGDDHPNTVAAIGSLGNVLLDQERLDESEPFIRDGLAAK